jgi:hypothetical protein
MAPSGRVTPIEFVRTLVMTTVPARIEDLPRFQAQRRTLIVLVAAQVLSGAGLAAGVTVGALF